jgi:AraC family transcriptional regulator of adaptative response/methylated-DNA-[protein]-cysteine methyltransferase
MSEQIRKIIHTASTPPDNAQLILAASHINTPLGPMLALADQHALYMLQFFDTNNLEHEIKKLTIATRATITPENTNPLSSIANELASYFNGTLKNFTTPVNLHGSSFQKRVWQELTRIPYGQTGSYAQLATAIGTPTAYRAVANANKANPIAIVIPCHRVIKSNGDLCGYNGGVARKQFLIEHEKRNKI